MMPSDECLYAHTDATGYQRYPAYINVTRRGRDGTYVITVRTRDNCSAGVIELSAAQWAAFKSEIWK